MEIIVLKVSTHMRYNGTESRKICSLMDAVPVAHTIKSREQYEKVKDFNKRLPR